MDLLLTNLSTLLTSLVGVVWALFLLALPWIALFGWVAYWLLAVDWPKLRKTLLFEGGIVGVVLLGLVMVLVWGCVAPPPSGKHFLLGLSVGNFTGKLVYVTALFFIAAMCGSVQLSGAVNSLVDLRQPETPPPLGGGHGHGHDDHGHNDHAHGDHGASRHTAHAH